MTAPTTVPDARRRLLVWAGVATLAALALAAAVARAFALAYGVEPLAPFYSLLPSSAAEDARLVDRWFAAHPVLTWTHILFGGLVLAATPVQFVARVRRRYLNLHRWSGRIILLAALPTGFSGLVMQARFPDGGVMADAAIAFFGAFFLLAMVRGYLAIRRGQVERHREWMIRMFAVGLGVGAVRLLAVPLILLTERRPLELAGVAFWLGLGVTAIAGEVWVRSTRVPALRVRQQPSSRQVP